MFVRSAASRRLMLRETPPRNPVNLKAYDLTNDLIFIMKALRCNQYGANEGLYSVNVHQIFQNRSSSSIRLELREPLCVGRLVEAVLRLVGGRRVE